MPVQPEHIKKNGKIIFQRYGNIISRDFGHNKKVVEEVTNINSKVVRNRVAGYITRKKRVELEQQKSTQEE